jgi:hypothetical protein
MVERKTLNLVVAGSIPAGGAFFGNQEGSIRSRLGLGSGFDSIERVRFANQGSIRADNKGSIRLVRESNPGRLRDRQGFDSLCQQHW